MEALFLVRSSRRARRILEVLASRGRRPTVHLLVEAVGRVSEDDHNTLWRLAMLGLVKRYKGEDGNGHWVVWNEITSFGRRVPELVEAVEREG